MKAWVAFRRELVHGRFMGRDKILQHPCHSNPDGINGSASAAGSVARCRILLLELLRLIGLFLTHARLSKGVQATNVIFDQIVRHLRILEAMPGHEGGLLIRRTDCSGDVTLDVPEYAVLFGDVFLQGGDHLVSQELPSGSKRRTQLQSALRQTFRCLRDQAVHALYIRFPGHGDENIDRLRLSLNIVARFRSAAMEGGSISFRYNQRTLIIPLIADFRGVPDPNLTLMAALNGLSAANTRALMAQACAFQNMSRSGDKRTIQGPGMNSYNQIFEVRSLRSQMVKPPVEVNNLPWLQVAASSVRDAVCMAVEDGAGPAGSECGRAVSPSVIRRVDAPQSDVENALEPRDLVPYLDLSQKEIRTAMNALWERDYDGLAPAQLGRRFATLSQLLYAIDKRCQDPRVIDAVLGLLRRRLADVPEHILSCLEARRQGLKINVPGRAVLVGMVHPRLFDLLTLIQEHLFAQRRIAVIRDLSFEFDDCHIHALAEAFGITVSDAHVVLKSLADCFGDDGTFHRAIFENCVDVMARHDNAIFDILWCCLKETPARLDRLSFLNAFRQIIIRLRDPQQSLRFLLADICQVPDGISLTDRNAFSLATVLLHSDKQVDTRNEAEDALIARPKLSSQLKQYAAWHLEVDRHRYMSKFRTIHYSAQQALRRGEDDRPAGFEPSFLLALEREALIFTALVGGNTARILLREALDTYGHPDPRWLIRLSSSQSLGTLVAQLQLVVRCLGRAGHSEDIHRLNTLGRNARRLLGQDTRPEHRARVKELLNHAMKACRAISSRGNEY